MMGGVSWGKEGLFLAPQTSNVEYRLNHLRNITSLLYLISNNSYLFIDNVIRGIYLV